MITFTLCLAATTGLGRLIGESEAKRPAGAIGGFSLLVGAVWSMVLVYR